MPQSGHIPTDGNFSILDKQQIRSHLSNTILQSDGQTGRHRVSVVAVGTTITDRPPHRSVRARLRIRLLLRISGGQADIRLEMPCTAHRASPGTYVSRSGSGACELERCSPESAP